MTETTTTDMPGAACAAVPFADLANAIRALAMDAVEKAKSGHPGMPMGMADVATVLFTRFLKFDPADPDWPDRDRFVLSAGHGSMLLYALLYLTGYPDMDLEQIRNFRQLESRAAGHPEFGVAGGIETTTGPLGQGLANAVGMALAERHLAARFGAKLVDHFTYVVVGDGCLMEGISQEAITLAGHLKLNKLIALFDDNGISIDGKTALATSEDQVARFAAAGWAAERVDGHDPEAVAAAIARAQQSSRPSLIACRTVIGKGAPNKQGSAATHGQALGSEEVAAARKALNWPHPPFVVPAPVLDLWRSAGRRGQPAAAAWRARLAAAPAKAQADFAAALDGAIPTKVESALKARKKRFLVEGGKMATRKASQEALEAINANMRETLGGSADLTGSVNTLTKGLAPLSAENYGGRYIHYGVREHAMAALMNGLARHGGVVPYGGTFLVFSDYCRPAIRMSALMGLRVVYVMTHDSIGLGEDGPTHQPVEHLAALRAMPDLWVFRPADAVETLECWSLALARKGGPSLLALSRQDLDIQPRKGAQNLSARGGYELIAASGPAKATLLATGSEVELAVEARARLEAEGIATRVVSMPCFELFEAQDESYRNRVIKPRTVRVAIEAGVAQGWERYIGPKGGFVGMSSFGASAPYKGLHRHFCLTPDAAAAAVTARP